MPNGTLKLYNKLDNTLLVSLDILSTFNIEDNLNETPSNMKVKVITSDTYREEFQVNTVAYHEDTNSWWVIKSDESTYITTGEYEHEIQLVEYLEFYAYRHLPNCAFAPNTYDLEDMLNRLFDIAKLSITVTYPDFLDKDKIMPFFSFENFTVANAIKNVARAINAIPKMSVNPTGFVPTLTFINRNGIDAAIKEGLNDEFPIAYEKNMNSSDQFTTRSVSNITNAKSSNLVILPKDGGFKLLTPNSSVFNKENCLVYLPSKIDKIDFIRLYPRAILAPKTSLTTEYFSAYYIDKLFWKQKIEQIFTTPSAGRTQVINNLPDPELMSQINLNQTIDNSVGGTTVPFFQNRQTLKSKFDFDLEDDTFNKNRTSYWKPFTNELYLSKSINEGFAASFASISSQTNRIYDLGTIGGVDIVLAIYFVPFGGSSFSPTGEILIQVGYYPIADIKVSIDNDNDAKDEKYFNQSGKVIDSVSVSKLITSHTNDSVEGTKIRNARYDRFPYQIFSGTLVRSNSEPSSPFNGQYWLKTNTNVLSLRVDGTWVVVPFTSGTITPFDGSESGLRFFNTALIEFFISQIPILPLGQLVRDGNQLYVVTQRSIDGHVKNGNEYYNVIYTLSRNRIARSENIVADSSVISYKTPDDNLVFRTQLYKDYIELSLVDNNQEEPYLPMSKALVFSDTLAGTNFDFTTIAEWRYKEGSATTTIVRHIANGSIFDLHKAKLFNINYQDNNVLGYRLDYLGSQQYAQTPILYTNSLGQSISYELFLLDTTNLTNAINHFATQYPTQYADDPIVPFSDLTQVNDNFYGVSVSNQGNYSVQIEENTYKKDPFEIPVFEYMIQGNDDYSSIGNIVIGNDLFSTFTGTLRYHYVINNSTRFTAENAIKLYGTAPTSTDRRVIFDRDSGTPHIIDLDLYSTYTSSVSNTRNTSNINNVGIYATDGTTVKFLFAINDYPTSSNDNDITVFINNWKI
jgi:hypothetical protein